MTDSTYLDFIPERKRKAPKPRYIKPASIKELERIHYADKQAKHPAIKPSYLPKTAFRDDSANALTKCIVAWLQLHGCFAGRVNTTGTYNHKLRKYIHSSARKGMADITAVVNGRHVSIEVKTGRDRPRPEQMRAKQEIEAAGGIYIFVRSFDDFLEKIQQCEE
ncbi:MAG: hypothetical protein MdMp024_1572 [Bacteroidales bacterium]